MIHKIFFLALVCMTTAGFTQTSEIEPLKSVEFFDVKLRDNFWLPRIIQQKEILLPHALRKTQPAVDNLRKTANFLLGIKDSLPFPHRYVASDLYKVMEGAAYVLYLKKDSALEKRMDQIIDTIALAQKDDGYLYEAHITGVAAQHAAWGGAGMGDKPYSWEVHSHELYNMGHMYEAAIAYYHATGKRKWLDVAEKNAQHINRVFFIGDPNYNGGKPVMQAPGHQEVELALVKLYHVTGNDLYLDMAKKFLEIRGVTYKPEGEGVMAPQYAQQHLPVKQQTTAVGHAVRAAYLYSAMADVGRLTHDNDYLTALEKIWHNIVDTKMHITGGLGAVHGVEGFGAAYDLPNKDAYDETCAAVGNVFFNYRMFLMTHEARYIDVAEVALYNNVLAGVGLNGNTFFYVNPLSSDGVTPFNMGLPGRSAWFNTACCPSNLARLLPQISGMMYATAEDQLYVVLYGSNESTVQLKAGKVNIDQQTAYPSDGTVNLTLQPEKENQRFALMLRVPTWAGGSFVPGKLYNYNHPVSRSVIVRINGVAQQVKVQNGFVTVDRKWKKGDKVTLILPMEVRVSSAIDEVVADRGRIAISRGPLLYCAEGMDQAGSLDEYYVTSLQVTTKPSVSIIDTSILKGITRITIQATRVYNGRKEKAVLNLVPYYAWNNRGISTMDVWLPTSETDGAK